MEDNDGYTDDVGSEEDDEALIRAMALNKYLRSQLATAGDSRSLPDIDVSGSGGGFEMGGCKREHDNDEAAAHPPEQYLWKVGTKLSKEKIEADARERYLKMKNLGRVSYTYDRTEIMRIERNNNDLLDRM